MRSIHEHTCREVCTDRVLSSLQDGSASFDDLAFFLLSFRKSLGHTHASRVYAFMLRHGIETHTVLGNYLVSMLVQDENMRSAHAVFDRLAYPNENSWNNLISGFIRIGKSEHGFNLYKCMQETGSMSPSRHTFAALLKACAGTNDLERGIHLHEQILSTEIFELDPVVERALIDMYIKCSHLEIEKPVFDKSHLRDCFVWRAQIEGYVKDKNCEAAFQSFEQMQCEGVFGTAATFGCILRCCKSAEFAKKGLILHVQILRQNSLDFNHVLGSGLIRMYAKCGTFEKAQLTFDNVSNRNVNVWNAWLQCCVDHGHDEQALECFEEMKSNDICPIACTFMFCLRACIAIDAIDKGKELHTEIEALGIFEENIFIGSVLVHMYGKSGSLAEAQQVFDKLGRPNVVTWTALIREYTQHGFNKEALLRFKKMQAAKVVPNAKTFASVLPACANERAINQGQDIYAEVSRRGLLSDGHIGAGLINLYSKCGSLTKAQEVMERMPTQDTVSWNSLIAAYAEHGYYEEALKCFEQMQEKGIHPSDITYMHIITACGIIGAAFKGIGLHASAERELTVCASPHLGCCLIVMYANCFLLSKAQDVFNKLPSPDLASWNALISGHAEKGDAEKALHCFEQMQIKAVCADDVTLICTLKACARLRAAKKSRDLFIHIETQQLLLKNPQLGNILVYTLAKCKLFALAQQVFDTIPFRDVVTWTGLISCFAEHGYNEEAFRCFEQMQLEGVTPNARTYAPTLMACGSVGTKVEAQDLHNDIERQGFFEDNLANGIALIEMYARIGHPIAAKQAFETHQVHDVVSWTALMAAFSENGHHRDTLACFEQMQSEGVFPDALSLIFCLRACGNVGALDRGEEIHSEIERRGLVLMDQIVGITLVDMYAKCGSLLSMQKVFDKLTSQNKVSWTTLIAGYGQLGCGERACAAFDLMLRDGYKPDPITFLVLLSACSRSGSMYKSQTYYDAMSEDYGIAPAFKHQTLMADILGRTGQVSKSIALMEQLHDSITSYLIMLGTCRNVGNLDLAISLLWNCNTANKQE